MSCSYLTYLRNGDRIQVKTTEGGEFYSFWRLLDNMRPKPDNFCLDLGKP